MPSEKHILITAAASNTGYGIAEKFVREGWNVHIEPLNRALGSRGRKAPGAES